MYHFSKLKIKKIKRAQNEGSQNKNLTIALSCKVYWINLA